MNLLDEYSEDELLKTNTNFITLGGVRLNKKDWIKDRGFRTKQPYLYKPTGEEKIREVYQYVFKNEKREIDTYTRKLYWSDNGVDILEWDTTPDLTQLHIAEINKSARIAQVDYLEISANNLRTTAETLPEPFKSQYIQVAQSLDFLLTHYESVTRKYKERNLHTLDFENAVIFESDPQILAIHQIPVRQPDAYFPNGLNVKQAIMYQIKGLIP